MIALSKTVDVGRDHLIHRKRSPFPYEGKALTRLNMGETFPIGRDTSRPVRFSRIGEKRSAKGSNTSIIAASAALPHGCELDRAVPPTFSGVKSFPS